MPESFLGDLIVFGAVALFVILRYRNMLGQKKGRDMSYPRQESRTQKVLPMNGVKTSAERAEPEKDETMEAIKTPDVAKTLAGMKAMDTNFTADSFMAGAKAAYDMVITAFSKHDKDMLKMLLSKELFKDFEKEIQAQEAADRRIETTLVSLSEANIVAAELKKSTAVITVSFASEQITVVRNAAGDIVEGDASQIQIMNDEWVFERDLRSRNPNWTIIDT